MKKSISSEKAAGASAVVSAALASMCCILPLGLGTVGLSGALLSGFFEPLRPYFLGLSALLLVMGFYFAFRKPVAGAACDAKPSKLSQASRPTLFVAAFATAAFAMFPSIVSLASGGADSLSTEVASNVVVLEVDGMTCQSCAPGIRTELLRVPGVIDAAVSYERKVAEVRVRQEQAPSGRLLIEAVKKAGYSAQVAGP